MSILLRRHCREPIHESDDTCPHCGGEQPESPGQPPQPNLELLPIFRTPDAGLIALAKSLLEGEGIEYMARGDGLQDLLGWGRIAGFNPAVGPVEFVVRSDDAPRARALLRDLARRGQGQSGEPFMMLRSTRPAVVARWLGAGACVAAAGSLGDGRARRRSRDRADRIGNGCRVRGGGDIQETIGNISGGKST